MRPFMKARAKPGRWHRALGCSGAQCGTIEILVTASEAGGWIYAILPKDHRAEGFTSRTEAEQAAVCDLYLRTLGTARHLRSLARHTFRRRPKK